MSKKTDDYQAEAAGDDSATDAAADAATLPLTAPTEPLTGTALTESAQPLTATTERLDAAPETTGDPRHPYVSAAAPTPRIRFGAVAWGIVVIALASAVLAIVGSPASRAGFVDWAGGLGAGGVTIVVLLVVGAFILLQGVLALLRRVQRG
jgi:hypothetical protein